MKNKKVTIVMIVLLLSALLSGCERVQLFETHTDPNLLIGVKDSEIKDKTYYVKDKTTFYPVYLPERGNAKQQAQALNETRVFATLKDDALIPTHYSDEFIAYTSDDLSFQSADLERFMDLGYSLGCYNGKRMSDGSIYISRRDGLVTDSSFADAIGDAQSEDIRIVSVDGKSITDDQFYKKAGIITGLEKDTVYTVGFYIGTKYNEMDITADTHLYAAFEMFNYGSDYISDTQNGYRCFSTPTDLKNGYYNINGSGMFRYLNYTKDQKIDIDSINMNESYYTDEKSKIEAYSRQYKISVPKRVKNMKIKVSFSISDLDLDGDVPADIQGILFAPDDTRYDMIYNEDDSTLELTLAEAMSGDWIVDVIPKTLTIEDVTTESDEAEEEATCEETEFYLPDARENVEFIAEYKIYDPNKDENNLTMFGTVLAEDGSTYQMQTETQSSDEGDKKHYIYYDVPYLSAGTYTVRIYHYPEETSVEPPVMKDKTEKNTDVIVIDG